MVDWDFSRGIPPQAEPVGEARFLLISIIWNFLCLLCRDYFRSELKLFLSPRKFFAGRGSRWGGTSYISKSNFEFKNGICPIIDLRRACSKNFKTFNYLWKIRPHLIPPPRTKCAGEEDRRGNFRTSSSSSNAYEVRKKSIFPLTIFLSTGTSWNLIKCAIWENYVRNAPFLTFPHSLRERGKELSCENLRRSLK